MGALEHDWDPAIISPEYCELYCMNCDEIWRSDRPKPEGLCKNTRIEVI